MIARSGSGSVARFGICPLDDEVAEAGMPAAVSPEVMPVETWL